MSWIPFRRCGPMKSLKIIGKNLGAILFLVGIISLAPVFVSAWFGEFGSILPFIITSLVFLSTGLVLNHSLKTNEEQVELKHAMIIAALGWLLIPLISTIPFVLIEGFDFISAFFEGMSGWTSTGLTMVESEVHITHGIQLWRSVMQWIGGIGVIVLVLAVLTRPGTGAFMLYKSEARDEKILPSITSTVKRIWWIFMLYTFAGAVIYWAAGMPGWEAINHAMTAMATGGFTVVDGSIGAYGSPVIDLITIVLMMFGAIAFVSHHKLLRGKVKEFFDDVQTKSLLFVVVCGIFILTLINLARYTEIVESFRYSAFQFVSAATTTGFHTVELEVWEPSSKLLLSVAMLIGGAAGSTAGGIKIIRGTLLFKKIKWELMEIFAPKRGMFSRDIGGKMLSKEDAADEVSEASVILILWLIFLAAGIIVVSTTTSSGLEDSVLEVSSAQGNSGLSTGIVDIGMNPVAKFMLIMNMWVGRLEIIPVLVLLRYLFFGNSSP